MGTKRPSQLNWHRSGTSNRNMAAQTLSAEVRLFPELGAAAMSTPEAFRAYRLSILLRHCEGLGAGMIKLPTALTRLRSLRAREDFRRTLREAAKLTYTNEAGELCGFVTIFRGRDGIERVRRHGMEAVCRYLGVSQVGRAVLTPISEILASVPKAKRTFRLSYLTRPARSKRGAPPAVPKSQSTLAGELHCTRQTINRTLKAAGVKLTPNSAIIGAEGLPVARLDSGSAIAEAKARNAAWCEAHGVNYQAAVNPGPYSAQPAARLGIEALADSELWFITCRLPSTIPCGSLKPASHGYTTRINAMLQSLTTTPQEASHTARGMALSVYADTATRGRFYLRSEADNPC